jgi:hypothetical protein
MALVMAGGRVSRGTVVQVLAPDGTGERLLRVRGIVLVAPVAEEVAFRDALLTQLARTRLGWPARSL